MNLWLVINNGRIIGPYNQSDALNVMANLEGEVNLYEMVHHPTIRQVEYKVTITSNGADVGSTPTPPIPSVPSSPPPLNSPLPKISEDPDSYWSGKHYREDNIRRALFDSKSAPTQPTAPLFDKEMTKEKPSKIKGLFGR